MNNIAIYIRLSKEMDKVDESESIKNQRNLLNKYAKDNYKNFKISEFVDEGFSGTSFDRPAFNELIKVVEKKEVDIVLVKDLSRLGRNYIDSMHYIEQVFPLYGVEFISINDNFNSKNSTLSSIEIPFKTLINDYYSKDLSRKIKSAYKNKAKKGEWQSSTFYGYRKSEKEKNKLQIDHEASLVIKNIFKMSKDGMSIKDIVKKLNDDNILTPMEYIVKNKLINRDTWMNKSDEVFWRYDNVWKILKDERYTGKLICNKLEVIEVGSDSSRKTNKADWTVVPNAIPKIISDELFNEVQNNIKRCNISKKQRSNDIFLNKIVCANCNRNLRKYNYTYKGKSRIKYNCTFYKNTKYNLCFEDYIYRDEIEFIIIENIKLQIKLYINLKEKEKVKNSKDKLQLKSIANSEKDINSKLNKLKVKKSDLIEDLVLDAISETDFKQLSNGLEKELENLTKSLDELATEKYNLEKKIRSRKANNILELLEESLNNEEGIKEVITYIDQILVYNSKKVEIIFNFKGFYGEN